VTSLAKFEHVNKSFNAITVSLKVMDVLTHGLNNVKCEYYTQ